MSASIMNDERLVELLVQRASEGLSANEQIELNRLLAQGNYTDADQFETTAAALMLASSLEEELLPDSLRRRLEQQAEGFLVTAPASVTPLTVKAPESSRTSGSSNKLPWVAAAACAAIALVGWWPRVQDEREIDILSQASADTDTVSRARERLLAQNTVMQREWKATEYPAASGVTGDVVWDAQAQVGYMRFRGLPMNNPAETQYQLWIFDSTRDDKYPVDGGVFNAKPNADGEVVVPILAKLLVRDPALFAVTVEKPGGVVVSDRQRIVVMAQATTG
jgi:hypothetical protein